MIEDYDNSSSDSGFKIPPISKNLNTVVTCAVVILVLLIKFLPKLFFVFWALVPFRTFSEYGIPYQYLIPVFVIFSIIVARILGSMRR